MKIIKFPSWRYNINGKSLIVQSKTESDELGPGWTDNLTELKAMGSAVESPVEASASESDKLLEEEAERLRRENEILKQRKELKRKK